MIPAWFFRWWFLGAGLGVTANWLMGQDFNFDLQHYHTYAAYSLLSGRLFRSTDVPGYYFTNPTPWVPYFLLTRLLPPIIGTNVIVAVQAINLPLAVAITGSLMGVPWKHPVPFSAAAATAAMAMTAPVSRSLIGTSFFELTYAPLVLTAFLLILRAHHPTSNTCRVRLVFSPGLLLGFAFGLKFTTAPYALAGAAAVVVGWDRLWSRLSALWQFTMGGIIGAAATGGWWAVFSWLHYGSPVFPFFNAIFHSPFAPNANLGEDQYLPGSVSDALLMPWHWATGSYRLAPSLRGVEFLFVLVLALICAFAGGLRRVLGWKERPKTFGEMSTDTAAWRLVVFMTAAAAVWLLAFAVERFAVPLELLSAPAIVVMVWQLLGNWRPIAVVTSAALVAIAMIWDRAPVWGRIAWSDTWSGVRLPPALRNEPATYVLLGPNQEPFPALVGFTVPYFPKRSRFVDLWLGLLEGAPGWEPRQRSALEAPMLRTIIRAYPSIDQRATLARYGLTPATPCWWFSTNAVAWPMTVCSLQRSEPDLAGVAVYVLGKTVALSSGGDGPAYMLDGWSDPGQGGAWVIGDEANLALRLSTHIDPGPLLLRVAVFPFAVPGHTVSEASVSANGHELARRQIRVPEELSACIPAGTVAEDGLLRVTFGSLNSVSPAQLGISIDHRRIGFGLASFTLMPAPAGC